MSTPKELPIFTLPVPFKYLFIMIYYSKGTGVLE